MRVIVTGAYGQLGGALCRQLGPAAIGLDVDTFDLANGPAIGETIGRLAPGLVINCAAYTQVDKAESEPEICRAINAAAVEQLAAACRQLDCPLVEISTDYVFGSQPGRIIPYQESDRPAPQGIYARTKLEGERAAARWEKHLIVRTCGLYAQPADERARNFVRAMLHVGRQPGRVRVVADQRCTPTYVPHVARAILFLAGVTAPQPAPWGTYHVTNRGETTWYEFAADIFRLAGLDVALEPITSAEYGAPAARPAYSVLDTAAYHRLGGPAMPEWREALEEYFGALGDCPK